MDYDLIVYNGTVVTVNSDFDILPRGWVGIKQGIIQRVSGEPLAAPEQKAPERIDAAGGIIMPGLVNTHTHLPMSLFRGLADDLPLEEWLNAHIFPAERTHINAANVYLGALLSSIELLMTGTTTCCDGYFLESEVARAVEEAGLRAVLGQGVIDYPAPGVPDPSTNIATAMAFCQNWHGVVDRIQPSIFCHSPYTCSAKTLKRAKAAAVERGLLFQIHVAETQKERAQCLAAHQVPPVRYLDRLGLLDSRTLLVHAVWIDAEEIALIAKRGAAVAHNPQSNMKLAAGCAPVPDMMAAGITVGLGTDGCASNNNLDLFQEMDTAAKLHKVERLDPTVMNARQVVEMATIGGARALGWDQALGSLVPGKLADLIVLQTDVPHMTPVYHASSQIVYAATGQDIRHVIVGGRSVVRNKRLMTLDVPDVLRQIQRASTKIGPKT